MITFINLAPELLHHILSWSDKKTLRACATVCQLVYLIARELLFKAIFLGIRSSGRLTAILDDRFPHKDIVMEITVYFGIFARDPTKFIALATVLRSYHQLQALQVITRSCEQRERDIDMINELLDNGSFGTYQVRLFGGMGICGGNRNEYPAVLCPVLTDLAIGTNWDQHQLIKASSWPNVKSRKFERPIIHTLRIQTVPQPWSQLEQVIDVSRIQRLSFWIRSYFGAVEDSLKILHACSSSLRMLSVFHSDEGKGQFLFSLLNCRRLNKILL
ncbi:hypothetical protein DL96DRAFT_1609566 [Flagelloscypha sp. PMI_526]|nr:hypothetical protein DL96DRAFT_1609566 [Flagelloscypha sp. PMI_526]